MSTVLMALGLVLVIEGCLPLVAPALWRETFRRILQLSDGQIRFFGLASLAAGVVLVAIARA